MTTCMDCGWPAEIEYVRGVVVTKDDVEGRYKLRDSTAAEVADEVGGEAVGTCDIRQRDCGCDGPSESDIAAPPKTCVCDYPDGATLSQWEKMQGHRNQAGGFCCPHHGNTCGYCHQYD